MIKTNEVLITKGIIEVAPTEMLSAALSKLSSSHDAAFTFSEENKLIGVINPYYALIKNSFPGNAKVEHCLFHPPKIYLDYPVEKVIRSLMESRIHYLPVFDEHNSFQGIVSTRGILKTFSDDSRFQVPIFKILEKKSTPLITIHEEDPISTALHFFKEHKVSKLVVTDKQGKLKGVLSYYDLIHYLIAPKERIFNREKEGYKNSFYHQTIKHFAKSLVLTLTQKDTLYKALELVIEKKIGSVVIIDELRRPIGIITSRDLMNILLQPSKSTEVEIHSKDLSKENNKIAQRFFHHFSHFLKKLPNMSKATLNIREEKNGGVFKVFLSLLPKKGKPEIFKREGKNLAYLLQEVKEGVKSSNSKQ